MRKSLASTIIAAAISLPAAEPVHQIAIRSLDGMDNALEPHAGKVLLVVNVASECGYTGQYEGLQKLHAAFSPRGFAVIGVPCNDFGGQEPGGPEAIQACAARHDASFPLTEKVSLRGGSAHPLLAALTGADTAFPGEVGWNFEKFVVGRDGRVAARFDSATEPDDPDLAAAIEKALEAPRPESKP